jgi:hypothetical protein
VHNKLHAGDGTVIRAVSRKHYVVERAEKSADAGRFTATDRSFSMYLNHDHTQKTTKPAVTSRDGTTPTNAR